LNDEHSAMVSHSSDDNVFSEQVDAPKLPRERRRKEKWHLWRKRGPILVTVGLLVLGWVLYALVLPMLEIRHTIATSKWKISPDDLEVSLTFRIMLRTCEYLSCFWFFFLGASIGSFINVVANRTPQGKSIISRGSHCPFCDSKLGVYDNIPVFGWIALRGRCRTCHLPIAPRYLIMEIIVGAIFMTLALIELMGNGMNLPHRDWRFGSGIVFTVFYPKWDLIGAYCVHASLFAVVVMLIASHMDRLRFPALPLAVIGVIYMALAIFHPIVAPVRWAEPWGSTYPVLISDPDPWQRLQTAWIGLGAGIVLGLCFAVPTWRAYFRTSHPSETGRWFFHSLVIFMLVGVLLGWQAVFHVALASSALVVLVLSCLPRFGGQTPADSIILRDQVIALSIVTITLMVHHLFWRQIAFAPFLPFLSSPA